MSPRRQAEKDIRKDLTRQGKCFIMFKKELNPVMRELVKEQLEEQKRPKTKFKVGDTITAITPGMGFEKATITDIYTSKEKKTKGKTYYKLKIMCGIATMLTSAECNYKLLK